MVDPYTPGHITNTHIAVGTSVQPYLRRWLSRYVCSQRRSSGCEESSWFILNLFTMSQYAIYHLSHKGPL
ncbi:hypothetical protein NC651_002055 [Populus alba x Populus x berolinensis]|nr:hypothetical protein NC651_002055 [Populus alba x Populus x berolinensis]